MFTIVNFIRQILSPSISLIVVEEPVPPGLSSMFFIVKTPTSTQHKPKTTSTNVGFDANMTLQPPPHRPTQPPELYSGSRE